MGDVKLVITPKDPCTPVMDEAVLVAHLRTIGLLGTPFDFPGSPSYAPGHAFRELIQTELDVEAWPRKKGLFARLFSSSSEPYPSFWINLQTDADIGFDCSPEDLEKVTCPQCGAEIPNWPEEVDRWFYERDYLMQCPACRDTYPPFRLNFDRLAAFRRQTINIWNIGKGFGAPSPTLLAELQQWSGSEYDYYYIRF